MGLYAEGNHKAEEGFEGLPEPSFTSEDYMMLYTYSLLLILSFLIVFEAAYLLNHLLFFNDVMVSLI